MCVNSSFSYPRTIKGGLFYVRYLFLPHAQEAGWGLYVFCYQLHVNRKQAGCRRVARLIRNNRCFLI